MLVTIPTFRWKSAGMDNDSAMRPIVRKTVALSKSLGPICDLVSTGVVATWIVGVFFGVGFWLLMLNDSKGSRPGSGAHLSNSLTETPHAFRSMISPGQLIIQLPKVASGDMDLTVARSDEKRVVGRDRQAMARVVADQSSTELGRPLSGDLGITPRVLGELAQVPAPPSQPRGGSGRPSASPAPRSALPGKSQHARLTNTRPAQPYLK